MHNVFHSQSVITECQIFHIMRLLPLKLIGKVYIVIHYIQGHSKKQNDTYTNVDTVSSTVSAIDCVLSGLCVPSWPQGRSWLLWVQYRLHIYPLCIVFYLSWQRTPNTWHPKHTSLYDRTRPGYRRQPTYTRTQQETCISSTFLNKSLGNVQECCFGVELLTSCTPGKCSTNWAMSSITDMSDWFTWHIHVHFGHPHWGWFESGILLHKSQ